MRSNILIISLLVISVFYVNQSFAGDLDNSHYQTAQVFTTEVSAQIQNVLDDETNIIGLMRTLLIRVLYFLLLFFTIVDFIANGFSAERTVNGFLMGFLVGILNETYNIWTDGIFYFFEGASLGIQEIITGTDNKYFLSTFVTQMFKEIEFAEVDIFDGAWLLVLFFCFTILKFLLLIVVTLSEVWAIWGFSFAKLIGPLFIPFIIHPSTRSLFDKWLGLLISFCLYAFVVRTIGTLFYIFSTSMLGSTSYTETTDAGVVIHDFSPELLMIVTYYALGIFMLIGAGKISSSLASGISSGGMSNKAVSAGKQMFVKLLV